MLQLDGTCGTEVVAEELVEGFTFEPRCLVLVLALENERAGFDSMLAAGRVLTDPFVSKHTKLKPRTFPRNTNRTHFTLQEIQVNYTIATGSDPDVKIASTNCHNSHVLLRNYELDTTGQAERDELAQVRSDITMYEGLIGFTKERLNSQQLVTTDADGRATLLSPKPSPPPPPPPVATVALNAPMHPPAPPETVSGRALIARYEDLVVENEAREGQLVLALDECLVKDRAAGTVCGLTSNESPYPWLAIDGIKCRGHDTLSTREGDYCGCAQRVPHTLPLAPSHPTCSRHACRLEIRRQSAGGRHGAAQGAPRGGTLLHGANRRTR